MNVNFVLTNGKCLEIDYKVRMTLLVIYIAVVVITSQSLVVGQKPLRR